MSSASDIAEPIAPSAAPLGGFPPFPLSVDRYLHMVEAGVFGENEPVFLWKGTLARKGTKGTRHSNTLTELYSLFVSLLPREFQARQEQPMRLGDDGVPEPDLIVTRGRSEKFRDRPPSALDVALIVEVADSSLSLDSGPILAAFADAMIPLYWIVNLPQSRIEVHSVPIGGDYSVRRDYLPGEVVPVVVDGREIGQIKVDEVLP